MTRISNLPMSARSKQAGLSLVELLVAMAVGLVLLAGVVAIYASMSAATRASTQEAQLNEDGALALQILKQQLQVAGYSGLLGGNDGAAKFTGVSILGCDGGFQSTAANYMGSLGAAVPTVCGTSATAPDAVSVRFEADLQNTVPVVVSGVSFPSNCAFESIGPWNSGFALAENRFFIAPDAANNNTPALFCSGLRTTGAVTAFGPNTALIPNVEDMQLTYVVSAAVAVGSSESPQVTGIVTANNGNLGTTLANWTRVAGMHICIVMRSNEPAPTGSLSLGDAGFYTNCAGNQVANGTDRLMRRAFKTSIAFRNLRPDVPTTYTLNGDPWVRQENN